MVQLDLAGQEELIRLIARSDDLKFKGDSLYKCEQINVCICAMADRHPEAALDFLLNCDERIGKFYAGRMESESMVQYVILRLCDRNPQAGLDALVENASRPSEFSASSSTAQLLVQVATHEPELVLDTICRLPEDQRPESLRAVLFQAETTETCTRMFQTLRSQLSSDSESMKTTLTSLGQNIVNREKSWDAMVGWMQQLNLSDSEKLTSAAALNSGMNDSSLHGQELADKVMGFLPPSKERDYLVWRSVTVFSSTYDPPVRSAFLKAQGIDDAEMLKLDRNGFLRQ